MANHLSKCNRAPKTHLKVKSDREQKLYDTYVTLPFYHNEPNLPDSYKSLLHCYSIALPNLVRCNRVQTRPICWNVCKCTYCTSGTDASSLIAQFDRIKVWITTAGGHKWTAGTLKNKP